MTMTLQQRRPVRHAPGRLVGRLRHHPPPRRRQAVPGHPPRDDPGTVLTAALATLAAGADLLLAEATLPETDHGPHGHLSAADAARVAQAAGVKTLVLTHFPSADTEWLLARRDEAARAFTGTIHLARPGVAFEVGTR